MTSSSKLGWFVALAAAGAATYFYSPWFKHEAKPAARYDTQPVDRGPVVAKVTASGTLSALVTVQVGSQVSGRVKEINVDFNSAVTKGMIIARIDPQLFTATLEQAKANSLAAQGDLAKAKAQAADAHRQLARTQQLADKKLVAQADLDTALTNVEATEAGVMAAQGRLEQTKASLHQAQVNLQYTNIISPIDGVVISRSVDVGQTVAASLQAPVLFILAEDLRKMQVDTSVAEADIGKLRPGMEASFTVDAYPQQKFRGKVRQIRNAAQNVQNVVTYDAVIDVDNPDMLLKPGMTANVTFVYAHQEDVLRVPNAAIRFRMPDAKSAAGGAGMGSGSNIGGGDRRRGGAWSGAGGKDGAPTNTKAVWVMRGLNPEKLEIKTGISDGTRTEVLEGALKEGDSVITEAPDVNKSSSQSGPMGMRRVL
jgi:HlyD family secretion protein